MLVEVHHREHEFLLPFILLSESEQTTQSTPKKRPDWIDAFTFKQEAIDTNLFLCCCRHVVLRMVVLRLVDVVFVLVLLVLYEFFETCQTLLFYSWIQNV